MLVDQASEVVNIDEVWETYFVHIHHFRQKNNCLNKDHYHIVRDCVVNVKHFGNFYVNLDFLQHDNEITKMHATIQLVLVMSSKFPR